MENNTGRGRKAYSSAASIKTHARTHIKVSLGWSEGRPKPEAAVPLVPRAWEPVGDMGREGEGSHPRRCRVQQLGREREQRDQSATHLTAKRWAGRSQLPPEGSPRPTVPSPASFWASLRSRADNYMSKWHSRLRARGGAFPPQPGARGGREGGGRGARGARAPGVGEGASRRRWLPGPGDPGTRRGTAGECAPVGVSATVLCGWCSRQDCTAISPSDPPLARSLLTISLARSPSLTGWSTIKRKRGKKKASKKS